MHILYNRNVNHGNWVDWSVLKLALNSTEKSALVAACSLSPKRFVPSSNSLLFRSQDQSCMPSFSLNSIRRSSHAPYNLTPPRSVNLEFLLGQCLSGAEMAVLLQASHIAHDILPLSFVSLGKFLRAPPPNYWFIQQIR